MVLSLHKIDCKPVVAFGEEEANSEDAAVEIFAPTGITALVGDRPRWELSTKKSNSTNGEKEIMRRDVSHGRGTDSPQLKQFPGGFFWDLLSGKAARLEIT